MILPGRAFVIDAPDTASMASPAPQSNAIPPQTKILVQAWKPGMIEAASGHLAIAAPWPVRVGSVSGDDPRVLCYSPVEWLVLADSRPAELLDSLESAFAAAGITVTDVSQGLGALQVRGPAARDMVSKACGVDFHPEAFPVGACARTRFAQLPVLVECFDVHSFNCYVSHSYLRYLQLWLADAAVEFRAASSPGSSMPDGGIV